MLTFLSIDKSVGNKQMNNFIKKSETTKIILKIMIGGFLIPAVFLFPGTSILLKEFLKKRDINKDVKYFRRTLRRIRDKKLIKVVQKDGIDFLEITRLGKKELLKYDIDDLEIKKPKIWDKKWRMVIFDIPEKYRNARMFLSKKLKEIGFFPLQKSVFIYPYECENEIDFIREFFGVEKFVILLHVPMMGDYYDLILKRHFNLL